MAQWDDDPMRGRVTKLLAIPAKNVTEQQTDDRRARDARPRIEMHVLVHIICDFANLLDACVLGLSDGVNRMILGVGQRFPDTALGLHDNASQIRVLVGKDALQLTLLQLRRLLKNLQRLGNPFAACAFHDNPPFELIRNSFLGGALLKCRPQRSDPVFKDIL